MNLMILDAGHAQFYVLICFYILNVVRDTLGSAFIGVGKKDVNPESTCARKKVDFVQG